jgi:hypothetical protein
MYDIRWSDEEWTEDDFRRAAEVFAAMAFWLGHNLPGTPIPDWCILSVPIYREDILACWDEWDEERRKNV